jgi:hypothetical protein
LLVGDPTDPANPYHDNFFYAACHGHYHNEGFSDYKRQFVSCSYQGVSSGYGDWYYKQRSSGLTRLTRTRRRA